MPEFRIESIDDPRIAVYRDLPNAHGLDRGGRFIAEGQHLVERLLDSPFPTESILTCDGRAEPLGPRVAPDLPVFVANNRLLSSIVGFRFHRGILACGLRRPLPSLEQIVPPPPAPAALLLIDGVLDPENLGACFRAAAALGAAGVVVGPRCPDPLLRRVIRVSMGAVWRIPFCLSDDLSRDINWLQGQAEIDVWATVTDRQAPPLSSVPRCDRAAILLGTEADGLSAGLMRRCRGHVTIPMQPGTDSLNVSMAAGIFLYHFLQAAR